MESDAGSVLGVGVCVMRVVLYSGCVSKADRGCCWLENNLEFCLNNFKVIVAIH